MARVLVVGGAGYIGSHAAKALSEQNHAVTILDNLSTGFADLDRFGEIIEGDLLDAAFLQSAVARAKPDAVFHLAAKSLAGESMDEPAAYYAANVVGTLNLLEAMRALPVLPAMVFASTCAVYGISDEPLSELAALAPITPFARSKRMAEDILADYG
ncbi:MAG: UDP-glucose 4-epimerase, partial [Proteobacteria bacterium]